MNRLWRAASVAAWTLSPALALDLTKASISAGPSSKAATVLREEVEKRASMRWGDLPATTASASIVIERNARGGPREGYAIESSGSSVRVIGNDERGELYGVGRLLRELTIERGRVTLPGGFRAAPTAPRYSLRGHQLGYRPMTNSYDGWTVAMWDQYIRDMAIFGANAVEIIPPRSDDTAIASPHHSLPPEQMLPEISRIAGTYGMDVWIWYPAMDADYSKPATVDAAVREWEQIFRALPKLSAVFVPGGDPGHTHPTHLMALLEKVTAALRHHHPGAEMWVSPQEFSPEWMDSFIGILRQEPKWLTGVVHGPGVSLSSTELRKRVPARYRLRNYPDITHTRWSQHAAPELDPVFAVAYGREPINPRPLGMSAIFRRDHGNYDGFLTYSEGCNDDVNKMLWSALGWNPDADVFEILRQYGRYFVDARFANEFASGLMALEENLRGPLALNASVDETLGRFQDMERRATSRMRTNWRFQMALYRAYYDAYNRRMLIEETAAEQTALDALRQAPVTGSRGAIAAAEFALQRIFNREPARDLRERVIGLSDLLFQSIRLQSSVERYLANHRDRGATLDNIDLPRANSAWMRDQLREASAMPSEPARLAALDKIVNWTNPGAGGFYDDLGDPSAQPHLTRRVAPWDSTGQYKNPPIGVPLQPYLTPKWRWSWITRVQAAQIELRYPNLDPGARYRVRVVYTGEPTRTRTARLVANRTFEIHPMERFNGLWGPKEFDIPWEATKGGLLELTCIGASGDDPCRMSEVWLLRRPDGPQ